MSLTVRQLRAEDGDLAEVAEQLNAKDWYEGSQPFTADSLASFLSHPTNFYLVAQDGDKVVGGTHGYLLLHPDGRRIVYIDEVDTIEGNRRQGVATAMMNTALELASNRGASETWVSTETDNQPAIALYKKLNPYEEERSVIFSYKTKG